MTGPESYAWARHFEAALWAGELSAWLAALVPVDQVPPAAAQLIAMCQANLSDGDRAAIDRFVSAHLEVRL